MATFTTHCQFCGKVYEAQRRSSRFCSDKCRLKNSRQHDHSVHADVEIYKASMAVDRLLNLSDNSLIEDSYLYVLLFDRVEKLKKRRNDLLQSIFGGDLQGE
jgi:predicted nucleic acid-binding Zn ribbon protein